MNASRQSNIRKKGAKPRDIRGGGRGGTQIIDMAKVSVRGKILLLKSKETQEGMKHFSCWGRMALRVTTHHIRHAWAHSLFQENSAASEGKIPADCCSLFSSAAHCIFIKCPGKGTVKATFCLSRESCTQPTRRQTWVTTV